MRHQDLRRNASLQITAMLLGGFLLSACGGTSAQIEPTPATGQVTITPASFPDDPACPVGAVERRHFPQAHAVYRYVEGQAALDYFNLNLFNRLKEKICWQGGNHQFVFRANLDGADYYYSYNDSLRTVTGGVAVLTAGCLSSNGETGTFFPSAELTILQEGLEMLAFALDRAELYYVRNNADATGIDVKTFIPADSTCR